MGVDGRGHQRALLPAVAALFAVVHALCAAKSARAQAAPPSTSDAPSVALSWTGPGAELDCLGAERLARAVSDYLGREAFAASPADLSLRVQIERRPDRTWRALLKIADITGAVLGERELASESTLCSSLDEPLKLSVALMVDSELVASAEPPAEPPPPEPPEPPEPRRRHAPSQPWLVVADASVLVEIGLLPSASPGLEIGLELRPPSWLSLRASGAAFLPRSLELGGPAQAKMSIIYGKIDACAQARLATRWGLSGCAGPLFGALFAKTSQIEQARSTRRRVFGGSFGVRVAAELSSRWSLVAHLAGVLPYRPERFVYELNGQRREFFTMSAPSLVAGVGCAVIF